MLSSSLVRPIRTKCLFGFSFAGALPSQTVASLSSEFLCPHCTCWTCGILWTWLISCCVFVSWNLRGAPSLRKVIWLLQLQPWCLSTQWHIASGWRVQSSSLFQTLSLSPKTCGAKFAMPGFRRRSSVGVPGQSPLLLFSCFVLF